jgi:hypothetical protein
VPLKDIPLGKYDCQVNLIDDFGRKFSFSRAAIAVLADITTPAAPTVPKSE